MNDEELNKLINDVPQYQKKGELVDKSIEKARADLLLADLVNLFVGKFFVILLSVLAPAFKIFIDRSSSKSTDT